MKALHKATIEKALEIAKNKGADACDLILDSGSSLSVKTEAGEISEYKVSGSEILGIRVIKDKKIGTSYVEAFDDQSLEIMVNNALEGAKFSKEAPFETIELSRTEVFDGTCEEHNNQNEVDAQSIIDIALKLEKAVQAKDKAAKVPPYNGAGEHAGQRIYANSNGTICMEQSRGFSCYTSALLDENDKQSMHYYSSQAFDFKNLDTDICVNESIDHARGLLNGDAIETGKYDIIFETDVLNSMFGAFSRMFSAKAAIENLNPLKDKLNQKVGSDLLTITDKPKLKEGHYYTSFDAEGYETKDLVLMDKGVLANFFHNSATAKELKMENTFNAIRSAKSPLSVGGTHTCISAGTTGESEIMNGKVFEIVSVQGIHSGADPISGNYSFGASGYLKENGKLIQAVKNVTISGNFYEMLDGISMVGDKVLASSHGNFFSPKIRFKDLSVAGK
jgi:PmbA protein